MSTSAKPSAIAYATATLAAIPRELTACACWVVWRYVWVDGARGKPGRWTKVPYRVRATRQKASSTDAATWATFDEAVDALALDPTLDGLGWVLTPADDHVGVDVDHCLDASGAPDDTARAVLALLPGTYCEVSPSGRGLRFFARGRLPATGRKRGQVELYETERFLTVTGRRFIGAPSVVGECPAGLDAVHARFIAKPDAAPLSRRVHTAAPVAATAPRPVTEDDCTLLARMFASAAGGRIRALYAGETAAYDGDASAADLALANHLLYWTDGDVGRADVLFRGSELMRPKWDELRGAMTYGQRTLATAAASVRPRYAPAAIKPLASIRPTSVGWAARVLGAVPASGGDAALGGVTCR